MSIGQPRGAVHGDVTDRILDAARRLVLRMGARKLALSDVANLAGVSRPTIYRYFASKDDLIDALGKQEYRRFKAAMDGAMSGVTGVRRLEAAVDVAAPLRSRCERPRAAPAITAARRKARSCAAPAKTPPAIVERLARELVRIIKSDEVRTKMLAQYFSAAGTAPAALAGLMASERERWAKVIKLAGVKPE